MIEEINSSFVDDSDDGTNSPTKSAIVEDEGDDAGQSEKNDNDLDSPTSSTTTTAKSKEVSVASSNKNSSVTSSKINQPPATASSISVDRSMSTWL